MNRTTPLWIFVLAALAVGCTEPNPGFDPDPFLPGECREGISFDETFSGFESPEKLDIVFVVDDSGDVEPMQEALSEAVPGFLRTLEDDLEVRATVVTADASGAVGIAPAVDSVEGCGSNSTTIASSDDDDWRTAIACNVLQGSDGAPAAEPLEVTEALFSDLDPRIGLFEEASRKLIIIVTNEDDCSSQGTIAGDGSVRQACADAAAAGELTEVATLVDSIQSFARSTRGIGLAVISGPPAATESGDVRPVCSSRIGAVYGAERLETAVEMFGEQGHFANLCRADLNGALDEIARRLALPQPTDFCAARPLVQEPLGVFGNYEGEREPIQLGEDGFVFLGETEACANGAIRVEPEALRGADSVEVEYCVDPSGE